MTMTGHDEKGKVSVRDCWADNGGVKLHYLDSGGEDVSLLVPAVFIPGAIGSAELYLREIQSFAPRRCIAVSLRGRGKSDAPEKGYTFEDHVSDIDSIIQYSELKNYCHYRTLYGGPVCYRTRGTQFKQGQGAGRWRLQG
jgi:hypothetical protein